MLVTQRSEASKNGGFGVIAAPSLDDALEGWMLADKPAYPRLALGGHLALVEPIVLGFKNASLSIVVERFPRARAPLAWLSDCEYTPYGIGESHGGGVFDDLETIASYLLWGTRSLASADDEAAEPPVREMTEAERETWEVVELLTFNVPDALDEAWQLPLELHAKPFWAPDGDVPPAPEGFDVVWLRQHTEYCMRAVFAKDGACDLSLPPWAPLPTRKFFAALADWQRAHEDGVPPPTIVNAAREGKHSAAAKAWLEKFARR